MSWVRWRTECRLAHGPANSMAWLHEAEAEGEKAGLRGYPDCPHRRGTLAREWWFAGYAAAKAERNNDTPGG